MALRRVFTTALAVLLAAGLVFNGGLADRGSTVWAQGTPQVSFVATAPDGSPLGTAVSVGQSFKVGVDLRDLVDVSGASIDLYFDPTLVTVTSLHNGDQSLGWGLVSDTTIPGEVHYGTVIFGDGALPFSGNARLVTIGFQALKAGVFTLDSRGPSGPGATVKIADSSAHAVDFDLQPLSLQINQATEAVVNFAVSPASAMVGGTFEVAVQVTPAAQGPAPYGFEYSLYWDTALAEVRSVAPGDLSQLPMEKTLNLDNNVGSLRYYNSLTGDPHDLPRPATLLKFTVTAKAAGRIPLGQRGAQFGSLLKLSDATGSAMKFTLTGRTVSINEAGGAEGPKAKPPVVAPAVSNEVDGQTGGSVSLPDDSVKVKLPPGATREKVTVTVAAIPEPTQPTTGMVRFGSHFYEFTAERSDGSLVTDFAQPLTLEFAYSPDELSAADVRDEDLQVYYWNERLQAWIAVPTHRDPASNKVVARVTHFTTFALLASKEFRPPTDITGHWAEEYVLTLATLKLAQGYEDHSFRPDTGVTRAQFAKLLVGVAGLTPAAQPKLNFADAAGVPDWAAPYVAIAAEKGLITGYAEDNTFRPDKPISRAEIATMVVRALDLKGQSPKQARGPRFNDASSIPDWAVTFIDRAVAEGLVSGYPDQTFRPGLGATRAEAAALLTRLLINLH